MDAQGMTWKAWVFVLCMLSVLGAPAGCSHEPKPSAQVAAKGAFDELRIAVRAEIEDTTRANKVAVMIDQLEQLMTEASEARKAHTARIFALNTNYDATEDDFRAAFKEFNAKRDDRQERVLAIGQRVRALTTSKEWKAISRDVARALEESATAELGR
jgi:hypothetical protein